MGCIMGRPALVCGFNANDFRSLYYAILDEEHSRGRPRALGGSSPRSMAFGWHADRDRCVQVFVHQTWADNTWWLHVRYGDDSWDTFPCPVTSWAVQHALKNWLPKDVELRWTAIPGERKVSFETPSAKARRQSVRTGVKYTDALCLNLMSIEDDLTQYRFEFQARPHVTAAARQRSLLAAVPATDPKFLATVFTALSKVPVIPHLETPFRFAAALRNALGEALAQVVEPLVEAYVPLPASKFRIRLLQRMRVDKKLAVLQGGEPAVDSWPLDIAEAPAPAAPLVLTPPAIDAPPEDLGEEFNDDEPSPEEEEGLL